MKLLCNVTRGKNIESRQEVYVIVVDEKGKTIFSTGNPNYLTCLRSSLKPFQASTAILSGATKLVEFNTEEIALRCASHNGVKIHINIAKGMAKKLKLKETDYECGSHAPYDTESRKRASSSSFTPFS